MCFMLTLCSSYAEHVRTIFVYVNSMAEHRLASIYQGYLTDKNVYTKSSTISSIINLVLQNNRHTLFPSIDTLPYVNPVP
jgi:hypothetical protein